MASFTAVSFARALRSQTSARLGIESLTSKRLSSRGFVPFRSFHASPASRLRQSPLSNVRNYYPSGGGGYPGPKQSRLGSFIDRIDGAKLVYGIIGLDILVWFGFQVSQTAMVSDKPIFIYE
jgi:hypothetical protein